MLGTRAFKDITTEMVDGTGFSTNNRRQNGSRTFPFFVLFSCVFFLNAGAQTYVGMSLNIGNRQKYQPSTGFKSAIAPSGSIWINKNHNVHEHWAVRYGGAAGIVGYKLNVVMIDTLGPNGDVSPFPDYSTFFASVDLLFGRRLSVRDHSLFVGAGVGVTTYVSTSPTTSYGIEILLPNDDLVPLFDARMKSPASRYSFLWQAAVSFDISATFSVGITYVYHYSPASDGTYTFYHTERPRTGKIKIYQREFRFGIFYKLRGRK